MMSTVNIQPKDIRKMLNLKSDADYEVFIKSVRFLFDILCYAKEGSSVNTGLVTFLKYSDEDLLVTDKDQSVSYKIVPEEDTQVIYQELSEAVSKASEIILPV